MFYCQTFKLINDYNYFNKQTNTAVIIGINSEYNIK